MASHTLGEEGVDWSVFLRSLEEIELLKLKYDNLVCICERLLRPWAVGKSLADTESKATLETEERKQAPPQAPPNFEVELLEKALEKARDVRNLHESVELTSKNDSKKCATVQKSLQLAKTAYAPPSNTTKSQACKKKVQRSRHMVSSTNKKAVSSAKPKPRTGTIVAHRKSGMDLKLGTPPAGSNGGMGMSSPGGFTHTVHPSGTQPREQSLLTSSCKAVQCEPRTSAAASSGQFRIQMDGMQLSMPSKYRRLQKAMDSMASDLVESSASCPGSATAQRFCARLVSPSATVPDHRQQLQLLLARDELKLAAMELTSLTPHELSVNQRQSALSEVLEVKAKLDLLSDAVRKPFVDSSLRLPNFHSNGDDDGRLPTCTFTSYSSLEEWQALLEDHLGQLWRAADRQMVLLCQLLVLPQLDEMDATDRNFFPLLKSAYRLCKLKSPVFVSLETKSTR